ncbi:MAG: Lon family ATP-dependent protease [Bacillota bacterium]
MEQEEVLKRQVRVLFNLLSAIMGADKLILKAGKMGALKGMRSNNLSELVLSLEKIVLEDPTIERPPEPEEIPAVLARVEDEIAEIVARRSVEERLEQKVNQRMQERQDAYLRDIKLQILREEAGPENASTLKKLAMLEKMDSRRIARTALEVLRPTSLKEVVGQERAISTLVAKLASPFPQHVLLYGPPGVGKTTVARLALEEAKKLPGSRFAKDAPFVEVDGATLRWDPREATNPLLGSVHDPIYQGARRDLAESGIPEPKLGLVSEANGGVLFIDEIGEMDPILQNKLLKVLEDKRVRFESSYYDPTDPNVPKYVKKLFEEGAPADFILIGATTRDPEEISPALRSRCAEVYLEPLVPEDIAKIVRNAAKKLRAKLEEGVAELIGEHTVEARKALGVLVDGYALAVDRNRDLLSSRKYVPISREIIEEVIKNHRLTSNTLVKASNSIEVGRVLGLAVSGFVGSVLEIEAVAFPASAQGKGTIRFNEAAGSMARDSVFNAASVVRKITGEDLSNYDVHVNVVGGGRIEGPSAGLAVVLSILSAIKGMPVRQEVAVTGEISIQGKVRPVGGIPEKLYGARVAGVKRVVIPLDNGKDVPSGIRALEVIPVQSVEECLPIVFAPR